MTNTVHYSIKDVPEDSVHGFHALEHWSGDVYRWTTPCAGIHICVRASDEEIRLRVLPGYRRLNVWQDLDVFLGTVRLDHHHVGFDKGTESIVLSIPDRLWEDSVGVRQCWLCILASPYLLEADPRSLGVAIRGIDFAGADEAERRDYFQPGGATFYEAISALFTSDVYRHHLKRKMGVPALHWSQQEAHDQYVELANARRFDSLRAKCAFDAFMHPGHRLQIPRSDAPLVSIVVVTYNRAELTFQCLRSILDQAGVDYEVVVVDNGSTDRTVEMLDRVEGVRSFFNDQNTGFLRGANQGASAAVGKHLLFLNNDTQLLEGCVASAVSKLESASEIGAVGARIIAPTGLIQEAGGIVWSDGSTEQYGRGGRADAGEYMFERRIDCCSGAFLLTPRRVFQQLRGFDDVYAPAYYEDTDYCLRLKEQGYHTVYSPDSALIHHEYASGGDDNAAEAIDRNRKKFVDRHRASLSEAPERSHENVLCARCRDPATQRMLYFGDFLPPDPTTADFSAPGEKVRLLAAAGCFVTMFASDVRPFHWEAIRRSVPGNVEVIPDVGWQQIGNFITDRNGFYDVVIVAGDVNKDRFNAMLAPGARGRAQIIETPSGEFPALTF